MKILKNQRWCKNKFITGSPAGPFLPRLPGGPIPPYKKKNKFNTKPF